MPRSSSLPRAGAGTARNHAVAGVNVPPVSVAGARGAGNHAAADHEENAANAPSNDTRASRRGKGYTTVEDLMIAKAFIETSEDPVVGASQTGPAFRDRMAENYNRRKMLQFQMDVTAYQNSSTAAQDAMALSNGGFKEPLAYPERPPKSIVERFRNYISPRVSKFMGIEETTPRESGTDEEDFYNTCNAHYVRRTSYRSFDELRHVKDYLKDKAKWVHWRGTYSGNDNPTGPRRPTGNRRAIQEERDRQTVRAAARRFRGNDDEEEEEEPPGAMATPRLAAGSSRVSLTATKKTLMHNASEAFNTLGSAATSFFQNQQQQQLQQQNQEMMRMQSNMLQVKQQFIQTLPTPDRIDCAKEELDKLRDQEQMDIQKKRLRDEIEVRSMRLEGEIELEKRKLALAKLKTKRLRLEGGVNTGVNDRLRVDDSVDSSSDDE